MRGEALKVNRKILKGLVSVVYPGGSEEPLILSGDMDDWFCILEKCFVYSVEIDRNAFVCIPAQSCGNIRLRHDQIKISKANGQWNFENKQVG